MQAGFRLDGRFILDFRLVSSAQAPGFAMPKEEAALRVVRPRSGLSNGLWLRTFVGDGKTEAMVKVTLKNYRESKDYGSIVGAVAKMLARQRFVSPVEVLVELKLLMPDDLQRWKRGQVPYLERVIRCNLSRAGRILRVLRFHAHDLNLKPSHTCYHHRKHPLRFSKSGEHLIEEAYARHFVVVGKLNSFAEGNAGGPVGSADSRSKKA